MNDRAFGQENGRFRPMHPHPEGAKGDAKTQVVVPVIGGVPVAVPRPAVGRLVVPATAPVHPVRALLTIHRCPL